VVTTACRNPDPLERTQQDAILLNRISQRLTTYCVITTIYLGDVGHRRSVRRVAAMARQSLRTPFFRFFSRDRQIDRICLKHD
jgi:hypothetical protein